MKPISMATNRPKRGLNNIIAVADGKQVWQQKRFGKSNLTLADGKLFISTMKGELVIVEAADRDGP